MTSAIPASDGQTEPRNGQRDERCAVRVDVVRDSAGLRDLERDWERLWASDPDADIFASFDWFLNWWEHFGHGERPAALVTRDGPTPIAVPGGDWKLHACVVRNSGGEALAILPLVLVRGVYKGTRCRILSTPVNNHAPRAGLVASRFDAGVIDVLSESLASSGNWDVLLLDGLPQRCKRLAALASALAGRGLIPGSRSEWPHSFFSHSSTWDDFLSSKGQNFRRQLKRSRRALETLGEVAMERFRGTHAATVGMDLFLAVDRESWKARDGESLALDDVLRSYYVGLCERFAARGRADVWVMRIAARPAAAYLCLCDRQIIYTLKSSFSEAFVTTSHSSPGILLLGEILRTAQADGNIGIDFVCKLPYIDRWATEDRCYEQAVFCRSRVLAFRVYLRGALRYLAGRARAAAKLVYGRLARLAAATATISNQRDGTPRLSLSGHAATKHQSGADE
jgi:hypothetical protein